MPHYLIAGSIDEHRRFESPRLVIEVDPRTFDMPNIVARWTWWCVVEEEDEEEAFAKAHAPSYLNPLLTDEGEPAGSGQRLDQDGVNTPQGAARFPNYREAVANDYSPENVQAAKKWGDETKMPLLDDGAAEVARYVSMCETIGELSARYPPWEPPMSAEREADILSHARLVKRPATWLGFDQHPENEFPRINDTITAIGLDTQT